jgi:hypothetical protein
MKTTLNLDDRLLRAAKKAAVDQGTTLTRIVEDALRSALLPRRRSGPEKFAWSTVKGRTRPSVDIGDRDALFWQMERNL